MCLTENSTLECAGSTSHVPAGTSVVVRVADKTHLLDRNGTVSLHDVSGKRTPGEANGGTVLPPLSTVNDFDTGLIASYREEGLRMIRVTGGTV